MCDYKESKINALELAVIFVRNYLRKLVVAHRADKCIDIQTRSSCHDEL